MKKTRFYIILDRLLRATFYDFIISSMAKKHISVKGLPIIYELF